MAGKAAQTDGQPRATPAKRSARAVVPSQADEPATFPSEGARLLAAVRGSVQLIADATGTSKQAVSAWRTGVRVPDEDGRRRLRDAYAIPLAAWDRPPHSTSKKQKTPAVAPTPTPAPWFPEN